MVPQAVQSRQNLPMAFFYPPLFIPFHTTCLSALPPILLRATALKGMHSECVAPHAQKTS